MDEISVTCDAGMSGMRANNEQATSRPAKESMKSMRGAPRLLHSCGVQCDVRHTHIWRPVGRYPRHSGAARIRRKT